jgi:hypothetical protein
MRYPTLGGGSPNSRDRNPSWLLLFVWFISFIRLNQTNQINQIPDKPETSKTGRGGLPTGLSF